MRLHRNAFPVMEQMRQARTDGACNGIDLVIEATGFGH